MNLINYKGEYVLTKECHCILQIIQHICSVRILNLTRYATGCRLRNGTTGCVTGCPVAPLAIHCCPVRQPDARRAVQLVNRTRGELSSWTTGREESCPVRQLGMSLVWLARPSHLIAGALRAGKGRSSGSND